MHATASPAHPVKGGVLGGLAIAAVLIVVFVSKTLPASRGLGGPVGADAPAYCRIAKGLLQSGTLELPPPARIDTSTQQRLDDPFGTPYALSRDGRLLPKHSWAFALLLAPGLAAAGTEGALAIAAVVGALLAGFVTVRVASVFGAVPTFLSGLGLFVLSPGGRNVATAINVDTLLALALVLAFAFAGDRRPVLAGAVAGLTPLLRPTAPLLFLALPFLLFERGGLRSLARAIAGALPGMLLFGATNWLLWGAPWITSYQRSVVFRDGMAVLSSHTAAFSWPTMKGLSALLFAPENGFLAMAPLVAIALAGFLHRRARAPEWAGAALGAGAGLLFLAGFGFVGERGAGLYRFGFPLLASAAAPLAALLHEFTRIVVRRAPV